MKELISSINKLKESEVSKLIKTRMNEFKNNKDLFNELCFCILTANFNAERSIKIQNNIKDFSKLTLAELKNTLKKHGHRYPNKRAEYIMEARKHKTCLKNNCTREWIVKNVKGLGMKEASHFLRNVGFTDYAIIDFHIIDLLVKHKIIKQPKTLTPKTYLEIENKLREMGKKVSLNLAELDLYLWYMETGKILK
ncbi:MAG: N-glycosylase/DNA lyase [Nanoarchaeota archaeon]|nr:N-glycosylase/DNA lyase [Nanoarchaeota archaeon]MBU4124175.1 N-glycosylase/DNA lyase [Nanoarchaeota archaeon]